MNLKTQQLVNGVAAIERACVGFLQRHYHRMHFYVSFELGVAKLLAWDEVWECSGGHGDG